MSNPEGSFRGKVLAIHAPDQRDGDGHDYLTVGATEVVPPAPEDPWVLSIDLSQPSAHAMCSTVLEAIMRKVRIEFELDQNREGVLSSVRLER